MHELTEKEELRLERNLTWIIASRRSGTSWLGRELLSHNTLFMNEPLIGNHVVGLLGRAASHYRRLDESRERKDYFFNDEFRDTWLYFLRKLILNRIFAQFRDLDSAIVIKEPNGSMGADILFDALPNSKMILLLRDPRDVIHSNLAQLSPKGFSVKAGKVNRPMNQRHIVKEVVLRSKEWGLLLDIMLSTYEEHDKKLRHMIKYENLRLNTGASLRDLYDFIGVSITDDKITDIVNKYAFENLPASKTGVGTQRQFAKVNIWKENFNKKEIFEMNNIMGSRLEKIGYSR